MANETGTPPPNEVALYNVGSLDGINIFFNALTSEASYNSLNDDQQEILLDALIKNKIIAEEIPYYLKKEIDKRELTLGRPLPMFEEDESINGKIAKLTAHLDVVNDIALAQAYLKLMGFELGGSNINGSAPNPSYTWQAIKTFQEMVGLKVTGIVDQDTLDEMIRVVESGWKITDNILDLNPNLVQSNFYGYIKPTYGYRFGDGYDTLRTDKNGNTKKHGGVDLSGFRIGKGREEGIPSSMYRIPVYAVEDGYIGFVKNGPNDTKGGGNYLILVGDSGYNFRYLHLDQFGDIITGNDSYSTDKDGITFDSNAIRVNKGDFLGYIGNTGYSTGDHLHFDMYDSKYEYDFSRYSQDYIDPENFIKLR